MVIEIPEDNQGYLLLNKTFCPNQVPLCQTPFLLVYYKEQNPDADLQIFYQTKLIKADYLAKGDNSLRIISSGLVTSKS